jgi:NAD(P)-dependent dehydrogenase (short-subunit alcohol dehydrogenase family)
VRWAPWSNPPVEARRGRRLAGKRALVTGASRGIGEAIARLFAGEGAAVALLARDAERLDALASELPASTAVPADVGRADEAADAVGRAHATLGGLDALVNAAAIDCEWKPTAELSVESWDETVAVNLSGTFYVCRAALPFLAAGGGGAIVNVTSVAAHRVWPEDVAYGASKAGVELLTRTVAVEYAAQGIRANTLAPGVIDAGMTDLVEDERERAELAAMSLLGRLGRADEVAEAALWLVSDASAYVTGTTLVVDGGFLLT